MTLIAIGTHRDRVEIISDTLAYTTSGSVLSHSSKLLAIPHLDTVVATQGSTDFGHQAKSITWQIASQVPTFDVLLEALPDELRTLWHEDPATSRLDGMSTVLLAGYSPAAGRFASFGLASDLKDFDPFPLGSLWCTPTPRSHRPTPLDARRLRAAFIRDGMSAHDARTVLDDWLARPPAARPSTQAEWLDLALKIRDQCTINTGDAPKTLTGGSLEHARLERGAFTTRTVHTFDDSPETMLKIFTGTHHPIGQLADCWCGSGEAFLDCHLAPHIDGPCGCLSGRPFRNCCAVREPAVVTA